MHHHSSPLLAAAMEPRMAVRSDAPAEVITWLGVNYLRLKTGDGGELYLTRYGGPFRDHLDPENWFAPHWFTARRVRLPGTSTIYQVPTQPVRGVSCNLVARFSRVGEEVPFDTLTRSKHLHAEFNSPFEEFARVMELRASAGPTRPRVLTKKPLAIYVPATRLELWQTGRLESKIAAKLARHPEIELDILRQYILLYGWIDGQNAMKTAQALGLVGKELACFLADITDRAIHDLEQHGFRMLDIKPEHMVLRVRPDGSLVRRRNGQPAYAVVDYELLERCEKAD